MQGSEAAEEEGGSAQAAADPLVSNGLGSPSCHMATAGELSATDRLHCETSGFVAASAPTGNFGIDVHIDSGVLNIGSNWVDSVVQDVFIGPVWMGLVWAVHALVVMLEWSFTIDLLPSAQAGGLGRGLRQMQVTFTEPWLPMALAVASMLALYRGIIRRRVAQTLGEALLMVGMMLAGLWVIADPQGTLGSLGGWANEAALGTLAVAAQGAPSHPGRTFAANLDTVFASAIEGPWCYLEFGNVGWCREPQRLDQRLRAAGLKIATGELGQISCAGRLDSSTPCVSNGGEAAKALEHSATMLRFAHSNGALFLAVPPNGPARNSINEQGSLLRAICQTSTATSCSGSAAAEAQFRTGSQTWSRLGGLLLIVGGSVGMLLLFGFLTLRLFAAALFSLLYLLLAPAMVLAPAFGESGRALFRKWGLQLLGSALTKLVFSFLLGVVLALVGAIANMSALGWWTQWLLMSVLWWGAYMRRHHALGLAAGVTGAAGVPGLQQGALSQRLGAELENRRRVAAERRAERKRAKKRAPDVDPPPPAGSTSNRPPPGSTADKTGGRNREGSEERSRRPADAGSPSEQMTSTEATPGPAPQLGGGRGEARANGGESEPLDGEVRSTASPPPRDGASHATSDGVSSSEAPGEVPPANTTTGGSPRSRDGGREAPRDYAALASLAGYSRPQYERLDPTRQREAREAIDRELATRGEPSGSVKSTSPTRPSQGESTEEALKPEAASRTTQPRRAGEPRSDVMRDAREVEAGRKRQLGPGRP